MAIKRIVSTGEVHRFQFVLTTAMKDEIKDIGRDLDKTMHDTIVFALEIIYPVMEKWNLMNAEADGKVEKVNWDTKAHVKLDVNFFRRIKLLHSQMNVYSLAIIVRKMLMLFIKYFRRGGLERLKEVIERFEGIYFKKYRKTMIFDKRKIQTQLSRISSTITKYIVTYNSRNQLLTTKILQ